MAGVPVALLLSVRCLGSVPVLVREASVRGAKLTSAPQTVWLEGVWLLPFTAGVAVAVKWIAAVPLLGSPTEGRERP